MENKQSLYDMVTIKNIDNEEFVIEYNISDPNNAYVRQLQAGQVVVIPYFIARLAVKHLIDKILSKRKISTAKINEREKLQSQIILNVDVINPPEMKSPERQAIENIDKYNRPSDLDKYLKRNKNKANLAPPTPDEAPREEKIVTHEEDKTVLPEDKDDEFEGLKPADTTPKVVTRQQLYDYAKGKLGMELDEKTMAKVENMTVDELVKEFDYPING